MDTDWCSDEVLSSALDILEQQNIKATIFITHETKLLSRMRSNKNIELGIHPNFNPLLSGSFEYGKNIKEVIMYFKHIVPEAISVRSHSVTQSANILTEFENAGFKFDLNTIIPYFSGIELKPYRYDYWTEDLVIAPYFWEDVLGCLRKYNGGGR